MISEVDKIKKTGATFTPDGLANFLSDKLLSYLPDFNVTVLDPACGDGALLMSISKHLSKEKSNFEIQGYDSNNDYLQIAKQRLADIGIVNTNFILGDFLDIIELKEKQLSLDFNINSTQKFNEFADVIIANPPYVRTQILGSEQAQILARKFGLKGRVDLYYPFLIAMTYALKEDGLLGVITSNRYLLTKSGESVRKFLYKNYEILEVIDLGDTKLFDAAVLPAIFIGRKKRDIKNTSARFSKIYEELNSYQGNLIKADDIFQILNSQENGFFIVDGKRFKKSSGVLKFSNTKENSWTMLSNVEAKWVSDVENNSVGVIGDFFKVRIGIKTTADKIFISDKWDNLCDDKPEENLLKDLISQENIKPWCSSNEKEFKVLYPHFVDNGKKKVIELIDFPKAKKYFERHEDKLKSRKYLIDAGRDWFEIWVPQNPKLWNFPKLVFPDISVMPRFYYDNTGKIVNGNCYWIVATKPEEQYMLLLIQGIANSKLMTKYHDLVFNNKLYSGRRRYFSQYVQNYPLPDFKLDSAKSIVNIVKQLNNLNNIQDIEQLVYNLEIKVAEAYNVEPVFNPD
ncbi:MAG: N-6 DNA methylase [Bacteroidetes bacterium]|nr:N-6 DNA methylase [Bacteroidota bacterium]MBL7104872.1 N-6 DNA methylase [Bacteroidales bacterium]